MSLNRENDKFFIIDSSSIIFRSYYAIRNSKFNVLYGFVSTMRRILELKPKYIVSTLDLGRETHRTTLYPEYKANRKETPDELKSQIPYVIKFLELLNIKNIGVRGFEADDIIASLVSKYKDSISKIFIVTKDKDLMQLVEKNVYIYDIYKDLVFDNDAVIKKYSVQASQILDYLAIVGDASDNIPGVKGIGPKGASILLKEFGTLEDIYKFLDKKENLPDSATKLLNKYEKYLVASKDNAFLSKKLASLVNNMDLETKLDNFKLRIPSKDSIVDFLKSFSFRQESSRYSKLIDDYKSAFKQKKLF